MGSYRVPGNQQRRDGTKYEARPLMGGQLVGKELAAMSLRA